ncbi:hypothetical protein KSS87_023190 [Heliosperma pusillum]|nr:hypothetical protein KSS87_023190 [Heliosperma pusillum]
MSFLNKGFNASKCKTQLKLTIPRIKLLRNRKQFQLKQMRKDIAKLLAAGQEATARIRVEHIIREENMMAAQEIIELFCELISVRLPIIETQRECPLDLKEAISSICFAAPRCADLPELLQVQLAFVSKYGKEFVASASALMPDCGVNRQLVELLSVRGPSPEKKLNLLKEIAKEHDLHWDPAPTETELFKSHEDLLNGPAQFVSGFKAPLPKENDEILQSTLVHAESEKDFVELEIPQVPKASLRPSAKEDMHPSSGTPVESVEKSRNQIISDTEDMSQAADHESPKTSANTGISTHFVPFISPPSMSLASAPVEEITQPPSPLRTKSGANVDLKDGLAAARAAAESADQAAVAARAADHESPKTSANTGISTHFVPFISPPSMSLASAPVEEITQPPSPLRTKSGANVDLKDGLAAARAAAESADQATVAARAADHESPKTSANTGISTHFVPFISPPSMSLASAPVQEITQPPSPLRTKSGANVDLKDVLAAARAAAESADQAAVAARAAASLAELRISELIQSRTGHCLDMEVENPFHASDSDIAETEKLQVGDNPLGPANHLENILIQNRSKDGLHGVTEPKTSLPAENSNIKSVDDESMFSYPNLFSSQSPETHTPETRIGHEIDSEARF